MICPYCGEPLTIEEYDWDGLCSTCQGMVEEGYTWTGDSWWHPLYGEHGDESETEDVMRVDYDETDPW